MTHTGVVRELRGPDALVAVDSSQCGSCSTRSTCYGLSGRGPDERVVSASNVADASVGDRVEVELQSRASMTAVFVTFLLPVLIMGAGYALFNSGGALSGAAGAFGGLLLGLGLSWTVNRRLCSAPGFGLTVVSVLEKGK
jgi:positive regulator of sigma E activity